MASKPDVLYAHLLDDLERDTPGITCPSFEARTAREKALHAIGQRYLDKFEKTSREARRAAVKEVFRCNMKCSSHVIRLGPTDHFWFDQVIGETRDFLKAYFGDCDHDGGDFATAFAPGPGVTTDSKDTSYYGKIHDGRVSFCSAFERTQVLAALKAHAPELHESISRRVTAELGEEKLSFVPKNVRTDRPIGIQPTGAVCSQLSIGQWLLRKFKAASGIDIDSQADRQRYMVKTMNFSTIDLTSASSLISYRLCREILPTNLFNYLCFHRCTRMVYEKRSWPVYSFSSMGNGYTFPLETLIFYSLARACYKTLGLEVIRPSGPREHGNLGVFGDDIVCVPEAFELIVKTLTCVGLEVNAKKSFRDGPFRESCGVDVYEGQDVRPCFLKAFNTQQEMYSALNALQRFYSNWMIRGSSALTYILSALRKRGPLFVVPLHDSDDAGWQVTMRVRDHLIATGLVDGSIAVRDHRNLSAYEFFRRYAARSTNRAFPIEDYPLWSDLVLSGTWRDGSVSLGRALHVRYHVTWGVTVNWDCYVPAFQILRRRVTMPYDRRNNYAYLDRLDTIQMSFVVTQT